MPRGFDGATPCVSATIVAWLDQTHYQSIKPFKYNAKADVLRRIDTLSSRLTPLPVNVYKRVRPVLIS